MIRSTLPLALLALATSCWRGSKTPTPGQPDPKPGAIDVSIASVTLADDCNQPPSTTPPPLSAAKQASAEPDSSSQSPVAGPSASMMEMGDRACEQSSVQLRVASGASEASKLAIKTIELLDENGAKLRDLTPRDPSLWSENGYVPWDQQIAPQAVLQVSYALSAPFATSGGTYTVRVVVTAGDGTDRTLEQKLTLEAEASLPPGAVT